MPASKVELPPFGNYPGRVRWLKRAGDVVAKGEPLLTVDFEYEQIVPFLAPFAGRLTSTAVQDGAQASGGTVVGIVEGAEQEEAAAPLSPIEICASCGVVRIDRATTCARCNAAHASQALRAQRTHDMQWASVACTFRCRMCGFTVPLNHLDVDGEVTCARCAMSQAFEVRSWREALDMAHDIADDMSKGVGTKTVFEKRAITSENMLEITASPGHPLCETCHGVLDVEVSAGGKGTTKCVHCTSSESYATPKAALSMTKGSLRVALAAEHRNAHAAVKLEETPGALAIHCPSCSAPLEPKEGDKLVVCKFCHTTARISDNVWFRMNGKTPPTEPIWLAFNGPSSARRALEGKDSKHANDAVLQPFQFAVAAAQSRDASTHRQMQRSQEAREEAERHAASEAKAAEKQRIDDEREAAAKAILKKRDDRVVMFGVIALFLVSATATAIWQIFFSDAR